MNHLATQSNPCYLRADDTSSLEAALDGIARRMSEEACDGNDDDCDGEIDDGAACPPGLACRSGVCVEENPTTEDPGVLPPVDEPAGGGCGCAVAGNPASALPLVFLALSFLALGLRRRA